MGIMQILQDTTDVVELTRAHRLYGTASTDYDRVVTFFRGDLAYACSSHIEGSGNFESFGLPASLVGDSQLVSIAFDDSETLNPLALDYVQIGT